ncbi:MAG: hypothetical protein ACYCWW_12480, partial [Deltaproteobacteria bacterium]
TFVHGNQGIGVSLTGSCAADLSGLGDTGNPCANANTFSCNGTADVETSASAPVRADHDDWDMEPPSAEDALALDGGAIDVSATCSDVAQSPNPAGPAPTGCP